MRYRDKKKLKDNEWSKRSIDLPFEDQVDHGLIIEQKKRKQELS
jgi:hypothetical protein